MSLRPSVEADYIRQALSDLERAHTTMRYLEGVGACDYSADLQAVRAALRGLRDHVQELGSPAPGTIICRRDAR